VLPFANIVSYGTQEILAETARPRPDMLRSGGRIGEIVATVPPCSGVAAKLRRTGKVRPGKALYQLSPNSWDKILPQLRSQLLSIGRRLHIRSLLYLRDHHPSLFLSEQQVSSHGLPYMITLPPLLHDPRSGVAVQAQQ
jgi:hypothetical protein